jgi:ATP-dependent DNA helicase RecQ
MPRFDRFRPGQEVLISQVLAGYDAFGVLPTGVGKSLTFQFPSLLLNGLTLVISPLVALMNDQVRKAKGLGLKALIFPSKRDNEARMACIRAIEDGSLNLLFISPEALFPLIGSFEGLRAAVVQIVVDEAHTLLTWGKDFRYAMQDLKRLRVLWPNVPILALTATATPREREEIMAFLGFRANTEPYVGSTYRKCLFLYTQNIIGGFEAKFASLIEFINNHSEPGNGNSCGIIYCPTKPEAEKVALALHQYLCGVPREDIKPKPEKNVPSNNGKKCNKSKVKERIEKSISQSTFCLPETSRVQCYHSGLQDASKTQALKMFIELPDTILVGTIAVGMGIDKNKVRFVVNFGPPSSINEYVQQIGRAGRDGEDSECLVLHSYQDWEIWAGRLDSAEKKLKNRIETMDRNKFNKEISRLNKRGEDLASLRKLFISPKCIHQAIGDHFGETIIQCKTHCGKCQDPYSHRTGRLAYLQDFGNIPENSWLNSDNTPQR